MTKPSASTRRDQSRLALTGLLEGRWCDPEDNPIDVLPVDVSIGGFGLLMNPGPDPSDLVYWHWPRWDKPLEFKVVWCLEPQASYDFSEINNMRRCGLALTTVQLDLVEVCAKMTGLEIID